MGAYAYNMTALTNSLGFPEMIKEINNMSNGTFGIYFLFTMMMILMLVQIKNTTPIDEAIVSSSVICMISTIFLTVFGLIKFNVAVMIIIGSLIIGVGIFGIKILQNPQM